MVAKKTTPRKATPPRKKPAKATAKKAAAARKRTTKKTTSTTRRTSTPRKQAAKKQTRKRAPRKPDVGGVVDELIDNHKKPKDAPPAQARPVEASTRRELELLKLDNTALGASALTLAKLADEAESAFAAATVLRELRMTLGTARSVGAISGPNEPAKPDDDEGNVVPESRLEKARREAAARGRTRK